jgi:hypothetical protein
MTYIKDDIMTEVRFYIMTYIKNDIITWVRYDINTEVKDDKNICIAFQLYPNKSGNESVISFVRYRKHQYYFPCKIKKLWSTTITRITGKTQSPEHSNNID